MKKCVTHNQNRRINLGNMTVLEEKERGISSVMQTNSNQRWEVPLKKFETMNFCFSTTIPLYFTTQAAQHLPPPPPSTGRLPPPPCTLHTTNEDFLPPRHLICL